VDKDGTQAGPIMQRFTLDDGTEIMLPAGKIGNPLTPTRCLWAARLIESKEGVLVKPSEAPGACKHVHAHICSFNDRARSWLYSCCKCDANWTMPVEAEDVPLITALRGGRPLLHAVK
jgi:hypothetical protein